jgi:DNA invertase Pin-like site-specific DNA recombinase
MEVLLKDLVCEVFVRYFYEEGLSYTDVQKATALSRSQVYNILKKNGTGVSSDKIHKALIDLGAPVVTILELLDETD